MFKKYGLVLAIVLSGLLAFIPVVRADDPTFAAENVVAVEVSTGKVLYEQNGETPVPVASITKLLTIYLVYEAIEKGELSLDTMVSISDYPYQLTVNSDVSNVVMDDRSYSVNDLLHASLITSANSAAIALAEQVAGSESAFVDRMRAKLDEWGVSEATIVNCTGLNNSYLGDNLYPSSSSSDENKLKAADVALIARRLVLDYPEVLDITSQSEYTFGGVTYSTTNKMLPDRLYYREGVNGLKTGTTELAGACFVANNTLGSMQVITVVLKATDGDTTPDNRYVVTNALLDYVYEQYALVQVAQKGEAYENSAVSLFNGKTPTTQAVANEDLYAVVAKGTDTSGMATFKPAKGEFDAPLKKGAVVGTLSLADTDLIGRGYLEEQPSVQMTAKSTVKTASWPISWWNLFVRYVNEKL